MPKKTNELIMFMLELEDLSRKHGIEIMSHRGYMALGEIENIAGGYSYKAVKADPEFIEIYWEDEPIKDFTDSGKRVLQLER